jgi:hypothetical protein
MSKEHILKVHVRRWSETFLRGAPAFGGGQR